MLKTGLLRRLALLAAFALASPAVAQIYIPPPDDDPDPVVMEPDVAPSSVTTPGSPPPPPNQTLPMTPQQAREDAKIFGRDIRAANEDIPLREGAAAQIPYYEESVPAEASHYQAPDDMAGAGLLQSRSNDAFQTVNDSSRPVANVPRSELERALAIQDDPSAFLEGEQIGGTSGECQPLPASNGSTEFAEFTCNVGTQVSGRDVQCQVTLDHHFNTQYRYTCTRLYEQGTYCADDFRFCNNRFTFTNEIGSACEAFAAPATGCTLLSTVPTYIGPSQYSDIDFFFGRTFLSTQVYSCPVQVNGTISGFGYSSPISPFTYYEPSFVEEAIASSYVNSTLNLSQCEAAANLACPTGYTLEGNACVSRRPADVGYSCEEGWTLNGDQCTISSAVPGTIRGYECPAGYYLSGTVCTATQTATITGYSCPSGYTVEGSDCVQTLTQPASIVGYSCPSGYLVNGSQCTRTESVPGTASYSCPVGWTLSGTTCSQELNQPPSSSYSCPVGWTLNGDLCTQPTSQPAVISGYACEAGWSPVGSDCSRTTIIAATPSYSCSAGWTLVGSNCEQSTSQPATPNFSCPSGMTLNGTICNGTTSIPATSSPACPSGWTQNGSLCTRESSRPADQVLSCTSPYVLTGNQCIETITVAPTITYECYGLNPLAGGGFCRIIIPNSEVCDAYWESLPLTSSTERAGRITCIYQAEQIATCPSGYTNTSLGCILTNYATPSVSYSCVSGETLSGQICFTSESQPATPVYSCPSGYALSGTSCLLDTSQPADVTYTCPSGATLSGSQCVSTLSQPAAVSYICPFGYTQSGTQCSYVETLPASPVYTCPIGLTLSGSQCLGTQTQPADPGYACPAGWNLVGAMCYRTDTQPATPTYSCPSGYTVNGSSCDRTDTITGDPIYSCPIGYSLQGTTCTSTLREPASPVYSCPANYQLDGTVCRSSIAATITGYDCPPGYTLDGQVCTLSQTRPASGGQSCPSGFVLTDGQCVDFQSPGPVGAECTAPVDVCTDSTPETRIINGVSVTKPCWAWDRSYSCTTLTQGQNDCGDLEANGSCRFDREICLDDPAPTNGNCQVSERVYLCPTGNTTPEPTQYVCGDDVYCINGECEAIEREPNTEFKDAIVGLNALGQANAEFDENTLTLFRGTRETCHKKVFGLSNCCSGKGVPVLTPFICSSAERELDRKDDAGLCTKVGTYCSDRVLGVCVTRKDAYCCYQSKISRILQEQGRPQIGKPYGAPRTEQCQGFTVDEFARLDLSVMDFREVYAEFEDAVRLANEAEALVDIQNRINAFYANNTGG